MSIREIRKRIFIDGCSVPYDNPDDPLWVWQEADPPCPVCLAVERSIQAGMDAATGINWFLEAKKAYAEAPRLREQVLQFIKEAKGWVNSTWRYCRACDSHDEAYKRGSANRDWPHAWEDAWHRAYCLVKALETLLNVQAR